MTNEKTQACWQNVNEIVTHTSGQLLSASQKQVSEYVREIMRSPKVSARTRAARSGSFAEFWSKGFEVIRDAGAAFQQRAMEAVQVIDKADKPVVKAKA